MSTRAEFQPALQAAFDGRHPPEGWFDEQGSAPGQNEPAQEPEPAKDWTELGDEQGWGQ